MATFGKALARYLAQYFSISDEDIADALEHFSPENDPPSSPEKKAGPSKKKAAAQPSGRQISKKKVPPSGKSHPVIEDSTKAAKPSDEVYPCEHVKRGQDAPCGKNARRSLEDDDGEQHWYCGTDKSGCYKAELGVVVRAAAGGKTSQAKKAGKPTTNVGRKAVVDAKSRSLLKAVTQQKKLELVRVKTKSHGTVWMEKTKRILFDRQTQEAYGTLAKNNNTILDLDKETVRWLEASNYNIRQASSKDDTFESSSDELDLDDSDDELDDDELELELESDDDELELESDDDE